MERTYTLDLNGTWTVFQECTNSRLQFNTRCGSNGSWTTDMRCPKMGNNHLTSTRDQHDSGQRETTSSRGEHRNIISTRGDMSITFSPL